MAWYSIKNEEGEEVRRIFTQSDQDLEANIPDGHTATPFDPSSEFDRLPTT